MNSVQFIGYVGQDPEFTTFQSGKQNARLTVAINNYRKDQEPIWIRCEFWEDFDERLKKCNVRKGTHISITGSLAANNWEKQIAGQKVNMKTLFARVQAFNVLTPKAEQPAPQSMVAEEVSIDLHLTDLRSNLSSIVFAMRRSLSSVRGLLRIHFSLRIRPAHYFLPQVITSKIATVSEQAKSRPGWALPASLPWASQSHN